MDYKLAFLLISAQICTSLALPSCVCTRNLEPVCGSDGITYNNQCLLHCAAYRTGTDIRMTKPYPCETPALETAICICNYEYKPVCGTDGQTYPNECSLNCQKRRFNESLRVNYTGECKTQDPGCVCPDVDSPVCGSDDNTYANDCLLNCATKDNSALSIAHRGACVSRVKVVNSLRFTQE